MADRLQNRLECFVKWIAPEKEKKVETRSHADSVLSRLESKAVENGIKVKKTFISGSFKKDTGLRRHMLGDSEIEGQDVDLMFVVSEPDSDAGFTELITRFGRVAKESYPNTLQVPTKCSVQLSFTNPLITYDLVPVYETSDEEYQLLVKKDLKRRFTSAKNHTAFVKSRTEKSEESSRIHFNDCVRLMKWWREQFQKNAVYNEELPSVAVELIFAKTFDLKNVRGTYVETLIDWFWEANRIVKSKETIFFKDFAKGIPRQGSGASTFQILDPVNWENNIAASWDQARLNELSKGLTDAATALQRAQSENMFDDDIASLRSVVEVFGRSFENHCGEE